MSQKTNKGEVDAELVKKKKEKEFLQNSPIHHFDTGSLACTLYMRKLKPKLVKSPNSPAVICLAGNPGSQLLNS